MQEGTTSRVTAADRPYGEFYDFYSVSPENFGYNHVFVIMNFNAVINSCCAKYNLLHSHEIELERKKISHLATPWYCNHTTYCSIVAVVTSSLFAVSNNL